MLHALWSSLARQLAVVWGLAQGARRGEDMVAEHGKLLDRLAKGDGAGALAVLEAHLAWQGAFDFEAVIEARKRGGR